MLQEAGGIIYYNDHMNWIELHWIYSVSQQSLEHNINEKHWKQINKHALNKMETYSTPDPKIIMLIISRARRNSNPSYFTI